MTNKMLLPLYTSFLTSVPNLLAELAMICWSVLHLQLFAFSALTLLVGQQEVHLACKKRSSGVLAWLSVWSQVQTCVQPSWCLCHTLSLGSVKSRLVLPFWYRLTWVVPEKGPLNVCVCVCVRACVPARAQFSIWCAKHKMWHIVISLPWCVCVCNCWTQLWALQELLGWV